MTFSRLTLGEPRLKSKLRGGEVSNEPPCVDPDVGASISEGWETYQEDSGLTYLALIDSGNTTVQDIDGNELEGEWPYFTNRRNPGVLSDTFWQTSTANPRSGSDHIRAVIASTTHVYATNAFSCAEAYWTARVNEGAILDISVWFSMDDLSNGWTHKFEIRPVVYDENHNLCFNQLKLRTLDDITTTGYNEYTLSTSIPPTEFSAGPPYWVIVLIRQVRTLGFGSAPINNDLDDMTITVTP